MRFADTYMRWAQRFLPTPFSIAVLLTIFTFVLALLITAPLESNSAPHIIQLFDGWSLGVWDKMGFTMQMMLILVLGHCLALTPQADRLIRFGLGFVRDNASAAATVAFFTLIIAWFNWGMGLIFGAVFARKIAEMAQRKKIPINYPLIGAAGYVGLMAWHGGISGSAPIDVTQPTHGLVEQMGVLPLSETVFSTMNITVFAALLVCIPTLCFIVARKFETAPFQVQQYQQHKVVVEPTGAEKLDHSRWFAWMTGGFLLFICLLIFWQTPDKSSLSFLNLNFINLFLFGLGLVLHGSIFRFLRSAQVAISGATGIMIQFPLYFGIMGVMKYSGMIGVLSDSIVAVSNSFTFPLFAFLSAGIVNIFVPSGGGQWQVQGPVLIDAAGKLGVPYWKTVMSLAYGDQLTNMLQPFWALPLLGITGLKAREILPYTLLFFLAGGVIYSLALILF